MQLINKPVILLFIVCLLLSRTGTSQINSKKKVNKTEKIINTPKAPVIIDTYKKGTPNIDLSGAKRVDTILESTDSVLKYFINQRQGLRNYVFQNGNTKTVYNLNSIILKHRELINEYIIRTKSEKDLNELKYQAPEFKKIYDRIQKLYGVYYKNRSQIEINKILSQINALNPTKEKVSLYLYCAELNIHNESYYTEIPQFCNVAKKYASSIKNLYEQANAFTYIGDFASDFKIPYEAIPMYYLAREAISNSDISEKKKNYEQGVLCDKLSAIFYSEKGEQSLEKAGEYCNYAIGFYEKAEEYLAAEMDDIYTLSIASTLWDGYYRYKPNEYALDFRKRCLNALKKWFEDYENNSKYLNDDLRYKILFSIGTNLLSISPKIALVYYIEALPYALFGSNLDRILYSLENISLSYALSGNKEEALKYSNFEVIINDSLNYKYFYDRSVLNKGEAFWETKNYDSALFYCNQFISDTVRKKYYYPTFYDDLLEEAYRVKYISLDSLKQPDSARVYERQFTSYQNRHYYDLVNLIYIDSKSATEWSERATKKAMAIEKELEKRLNDNLIIKQALLDSANVYADRERALALKTDSLRIRDSISSAKNIAQEKKNTEDQKKLAEEQKTFKNWVIVGSVIAAIILVSIILIGRSYYRLRIKERESALRVTQSEVKRIDELARNKIHNIENDYSEIGVLLNSNQLDKLKLYIEEYESFLAAFLSNWKSDTIVTLEDELVATRRYCNVKAVLNNNFRYQIIAPLEPKNKIKFLQSVFDTLLDNTIRYSSKTDQNELLFTINIERTGKFIKCVVTDNGTPPSNDSKYLAEEKSGLNLLKSRIKNFYLGINREAPKEYFIVKSIKDKKGTEIQITLPYEEI